PSISKESEGTTQLGTIAAGLAPSSTTRRPPPSSRRNSVSNTYTHNTAINIATAYSGVCCPNPSSSLSGYLYSFLFALLSAIAHLHNQRSISSVSSNTDVITVDGIVQVKVKRGHPPHKITIIIL